MRPFAHVGRHADRVEREVERPAEVLHRLVHEVFQIGHRRGVGRDDQALHLAASSLSVPMRSDTGVLVSTISAPSSTARSATFHAIDCSLSAPKMIPFFPFNRLNDIKFSFLVTGRRTQSLRASNPVKQGVKVSIFFESPDSFVCLSAVRPLAGRLSADGRSIAGRSRRGDRRRRRV